MFGFDCYDRFVPPQQNATRLVRVVYSSVEGLRFYRVDLAINIVERPRTSLVLCASTVVRTDADSPLRCANLANGLSEETLRLSCLVFSRLSQAVIGFVVELPKPRGLRFPVQVSR